jgi:rhodanese-related sulfurtransferase
MKVIKADELKQLLDRGSVLLVDVREPAENSAECIENACLIPLGELSVEKLPHKSGAIVMHCRSGKRSSDACKKLLAQDPSLKVYSLEGGIIAWRQAGFHVKTSAVTSLPLERQTQIASGCLAFVGTILGAFITPIFYIIPGFVGLGLMFAGITGWCGMARLLAKMPWNKAAKHA